MDDRHAHITVYKSSDVLILEGEMDLPYGLYVYLAIVIVNSFYSYPCWNAGNSVEHNSSQVSVALSLIFRLPDDSALPGRGPGVKSSSGTGTHGCNLRTHQHMHFYRTRD